MLSSYHGVVSEFRFSFIYSRIILIGRKVKLISGYGEHSRFVCDQGQLTKRTETRAVLGGPQLDATFTAKRKTSCREVVLFAVNLFPFAVRFFFLPLDYSFCRKSFSFCREVNSSAVTVVGHRTGQYCKSKLASGFVFQRKADWLSFQT